MKIAVYNLHNMCEHNTLFLSRARRYFELNRHLATDGRTDAGGDADLLFIGGCAVTDAMRARCEEKVRAVMETNKQSRVVIFGCLAAFPDGFRSMPGADKRLSYIPFRESGRLDDLTGAQIAFDEVIVNHLTGHVPYQPRMGSDDAYVLIAQGCVNACSYCTIKKAKGAVMSRPEEAIEEEVRRLYSGGMERVTLLADDCGSYGHDLGSDLPSLLRRLTRAVPGMDFKVYTLFPGLFLQQVKELEPFFAAGRISCHLSTLLYRTGVERLYSFSRNEEQALTNAVGCFGKEMERFRLLWARGE